MPAREARGLNEGPSRAGPQVSRYIDTNKVYGDGYTFYSYSKIN